MSASLDEKSCHVDALVNHGRNQWAPIVLGVVVHVGAQVQAPLDVCGLRRLEERAGMSGAAIRDLSVCGAEGNAAEAIHRGSLLSVAAWHVDAMATTVSPWRIDRSSRLPCKCLRRLQERRHAG